MGLKSILKKSRRHSNATRMVEILEHREAVLNRFRAGLLDEPTTTTESDPEPVVVQSCRRVSRDYCTIGRRAKDSLDYSFCVRRHLPRRRPPRILKPLKPKEPPKDDDGGSCPRSVSASPRSSVVVLTPQGPVRRERVLSSTSDDSTVVIDIDVHVAPEREAPFEIFNKLENKYRKCHAIARGELFPPLDTHVNAEYGLILVDQLPPITDLRPYTMSVDAALAKNQRDIESGRWFPDERRLIRHHPQQQLDDDESFVVDVLGCLNAVDHVFVKVLKFLPVDVNADLEIGQRVLVTPRGRILFSLSDTRHKFYKCLFGRKFKIIMFDTEGDPILTFKGHQCGWRGYMEVNIGAEHRVIGTIEQYFCDTTYKVMDAEGTIVNRIQGPCYGVCVPCCFWCCNEHHEIMEDDGVTEVGTVRKHWKKPYQMVDGMMGVSFPDTLPTETKALFIGFLLLVDFQYYRRGGNGVGVSVVFLLLIAVAILCLLKFRYKLF